MYHYNFKSSGGSEIWGSIIGGVIVVVAVLACTALYAGDKEKNAHRHAQELGLKNYKINCDSTPWACGCTITWEVDYGQRTEKFACCGWGCE